MSSPNDQHEPPDKIAAQIETLDPACEEIVGYAKVAPYGAVTRSRSQQYFGPTLHDTWGVKRGGRVHIDLGCGGYHLMLDKYSAWDFVEFVKEERSIHEHTGS